MARARAAIESLFEEEAPVLVEARFVRMATSPDWHLLTDIEEFDALLKTLGAGVELHLNSVWELTSPRGELVVKVGDLK